MFWPYCPKNPNLKFQFQPLWNKIGKLKNLANYPKGEPVVCFEKMHAYAYEVSVYAYVYERQ